MSEHQQPNELPEDLILSRVVDRTATPADWSALTLRAGTDPELWQRLATTLRDECVLRDAMRTHSGAAPTPPFGSVAQRFEVADRPAHAPTNARTARKPQPRKRRSSRRALAESLRAVVALGAVLGIFWLGRWYGSTASVPDRTDAATTEVQPATTESNQLFARYLEQRSTEGGLVEQLPDVTLTSTATDDGRVEVLFLRRIVERTIVRDAWTMAVDEHGNPDPIRVPAIEAVAATNF